MKFSPGKNRIDQKNALIYEAQFSFFQDPPIKRQTPALNLLTERRDE